jgi:hypothetical protein
MTTDKIGEGIKGEPDDGKPADFEVCPECGQAFDPLDMAQVVHHGTPNHKPIPPNA